ncbi:bifunctional [glutamate--ammonia ligase]-adenylyl-L-tyrosine phosphorylase/[glutamate--ammonia-ligase] adenylyltransferase [Sphingomonas sp. RB1R13]|uniref:bifunctional [glutamate--ammonia ligase]-adenylyl-L-tyrosine phosphorylase/[glutamate--ammonia-ligase] adenylyltransferase n=1 Tax=Sphingomonas sp. RB1R13 TaxID=3096159 RepID=UPI002FC93425
MSFAPYLREAINALPTLTNIFLEQGAEDAVAGALALLDGEGGVLLRRRRRALALAVALGDLAGELPLERVTAALSDFADAALNQAISQAIVERVPGAEPVGMAALALGKLGSRELNYSSDIDLILIFDPKTLPRRERDDPGESAVRIARRVVELMQARTADGYVARVDLRLRPSSEITPIVLPVDAAIAHYESSALPWERAAFIRARAAAGDIALGQHFLREIHPFIWRRALDFGAIDEVRQLSVRIRDHYEKGQAFGPGYDLKRGTGGIREVEFFAQVQQLIHGGRDPSLRAPATLDALDALVTAGWVHPGVGAEMAEAYRALRTAEHRVQMVDDQQTHRLPADPAALDGVARLAGYADAAGFTGWLAPHVRAVSAQFDALLGDSGERLSLDPQRLVDELAALGFADVATAAKRINDWRSGRARSLRSPAALAAFEAMLPAIMGAIGGAGDPPHALNRLADLIERVPSGVNLFRLLEARPALAQLLAVLLSHAPLLADQLARRPDLLDGVIDDTSFDAPLEAGAIKAELAHAIDGEPLDRALEITRRTVNERRFAYGIQLVTAHRDPLDIARGYSELAEGAIGALADATAADFAVAHGVVPGGELMILGLGRLGGKGLTHASDLDLVFLFDAPEGARSDGTKPLTATDYYNRLASRIVSSLSISTAAGPLYEVDTRLRPQGSEGMLAVTLDGFDRYQREEAWTWEHMALCRARPVYGSFAGRDRLAEIVHALVAMPRDADKVRADARQMRFEMARHKPPSGPLDVKLGDGGLVDLEFAIHTQQLVSGVGLDPQLEVAIAALAKAGLADPAIDGDMRLLLRMLVTLRLVARGGEPAPSSRQLVAEVCGASDWETLLAAERAARQRISTYWNEVKHDW